MLFNSIEFLIFFPLAVFVYFAIRQKYRIFWLLLCSCYFYMVFRPSYILILAFTIVIDYLAGIIIERTHSKVKKKLWLCVSVVANVGILAFFKYYNFISDNINHLFAWFSYGYNPPILNIILPVGLSFHTFQALSYTVEVYRGRQHAEKNFLTYALYVMFFPQLVAGPIERPQNLLHQFYEKHIFEINRVQSGIALMLWGLFKKMVVSDRFSPFVDAVYSNVYIHKGPELLFATLLFAFQIYFDFSAYTDIARGSARVLGFELMQNFNRPYAAQSISDFWKRWHISLSTWFKDYVYIPLGGSRVSGYKIYANILIVFLLSGLWHGANWTFVLWGLLNGIYLIISRVTAGFRQRVVRLVQAGDSAWLKFLSWLWVFSLVNLAWVLFRSASLNEAIFVYKGLFIGWDFYFFQKVLPTWLPMLVLGGGIGLVELAEWKKTTIRYWSEKFPGLVAPALIILLALIFLFGSFQNKQFIYFQF